MNTRNNLLLFGSLGLAGYLVYRFFIKKSTTEQSQAQAQAAIDAYVNKAITSGTATKSSGEWAIIANTIYEDLKYSAVDDKKDDATYQVARVQNEADLGELFKQFGRRQEYFFGLPIGDEKDLPTFVRSNLSAKQIELINDNYRRKGITFRY